MANQDILNSLSTNTQIPLDGKRYFKTLATLSDLGASDHLAFKYYEYMIVQCVENGKQYVWRELESLNEQGLLLQAFEYPANSIVNGIDYSNRFFNFFEFQEFTDSQIDRLKDLVYERIVQSISVSPTIFEKGLATNLTFTWNVNKKDDTLNGVLLDGIDKLAEATGINRTYILNSQLTTKTVTLASTVTENDVNEGTRTVTNSVTSTAYIPQYTGAISIAEPLYTYVELNVYTKYIQSSNVINFTNTYTDEYAFIISKSNSLTLKDGNDFALTVGDWTSNTTFFIKKQITTFLSDGTTETMYIYRTREKVNATVTFKAS